MPTLGERLTFLQAERQLLKKDIAAAAGLSLMGYYRYERGERQPPADVLIALADYFDVSLDYLVGRSGDLLPASAGIFTVRFIGHSLCYPLR